MAEEVINVTQPPAFLQDYYAALAKRGMELGNKEYTPYSKDLVAGWNTQQDQAAKMIQARALGGSQAMNQAGSYFGNLMNGQYNVNAQNNPYMGQNNPYLNNAINQAQNDVTSRIDSKFNGNAFGGTAHQQTLARELGNVSNNMRMQDYTQQIGLNENAVNRNLSAQQFNAGQQMQGLNFAPTLAANDYADAQAMMGLGNQLQGYNQQIADANYNQFLRQQDWPGQQMNYMAMGLNPAGSVFQNRTTSGGGGSNLASGLAGAAAGYGMASNSNGFMNPWLGAAAGGLLGYFGG